MSSHAAASDDKENASISLHPLGKSARITRATTALRDISNTAHLRDRAASSGLSARDKPTQPNKKGQVSGRTAEAADDNTKVGETVNSVSGSVSQGECR